MRAISFLLSPHFQQSCIRPWVRVCGLVVNFTLPWLGVSPDGLVHDPLKNSLGILQIKCSYTYCLFTVEETAADRHFCASMDGTVTLKQGSSQKIFPAW